MDLFNYDKFVENKSLESRERFIPTDDIDISQGINQLTLDERIRLAERGNKEDLDILVDDPDYRVRELVASHGYDAHLSQLVTDPSPIVRGEVAAHGRERDLETLKKDKNSELKAYVKEKLKNE